VSSINVEGVTEYEVVDKPPPYWVIPPGKKIMLQFNQSIQPVGFSANKFRRTYGSLVRGEAFVNMRDEWGAIATDKRQRLWEALMLCNFCNTLFIYFFFCFFFFFFLLFNLISQILNCAGRVLHPAYC
jgi:hypothetical protein